MKVISSAPLRGRETKRRFIPIVTCVVAVALVAAEAYVWQRSRNSLHDLPNYAALGLTCLAIGAGGAAWGVWAARSRLQGRLARPLATLGVMVLAVALMSATMHAWAYTVPTGRYARSYGGADRCLADTVYASSRVHISVGLTDKLTAKPFPTDATHPKLHFRHGSKGRLSPADNQTRQILEEHGC
ncbi:hypothetical protein [Streptomyces sp. YIM S03343]